MANVKVYTRPGCPWCTKVKEFLTEHDIKFEEKDVMADSTAMEELEKLDQAGVPVTFVDNTMFVGFDPEALKKALDIKE